MISAPETGQIVDVRTRRWIVTDVKASALDREAAEAGQNLVSLASLDEDALGESLSVIWELEPGARILDTAGLPKLDGSDDPERLQAFLDAVRWGAATAADRSLLQAPFRSGIQIEEYQLDPLVRSLDMPRVNLLIADDVGLGKTIEAGLVVQELLIRNRARSVLIVCPASLQVKWQTEMLEKFGLLFKIVDTEYVRQLRREQGIRANPWTFSSRLIASMDWMKGGEGLRLLKDALPVHPGYPRRFDILIVDEAHNVAPAGGQNCAIPSQRTNLIRTLSPHCEHRLFLSATPHDGNRLSFTALLELLDDQRFIRTVMPDEEVRKRIMVRRLKSDLPGFPKREPEPLRIDYSAEEKEIHRLLRDYSKSRHETMKESVGAAGTDFILTLLKKRLFSSPRAFASTLAKHISALRKPRAVRPRRLLDDRILRKAILRAKEEYAKDDKAEQAQEEGVQEVSLRIPPPTPAEEKMLDRLTQWASRSSAVPDSKARKVLAWLGEHLRPEGRWNRRRVVIFTEYRSTLSWMQQILAAEGYAGDRLMILHGGVDSDEREKIKAAFQADPDVAPVRILLATDAASEGIDLQNWCSDMIHLEIPWNPNVLEQRNGRIDRHGQKAEKVRIWHPVGADYDPAAAVGKKPGELEGDLEYLMRAATKLEAIREDLGSVGPVIARQVEEAMLGRREKLDTTGAEKEAEASRKWVAADRNLKDRIARLHEALLEAKSLQHLEPERVVRAVQTALALAGKPALVAAKERDVFNVPVMTGTWDDDLVGLAHPHTNIRRPISFDSSIVKNRDDVVLAHLGHRFVQRCLRLLRAQIWSSTGRDRLHRVAVRSIPDRLSGVPIVVVWSRLVIAGASHSRLHEELTVVGAELKPRGISRIGSLGRVEELLAGATPVSPSPRLLADLGTLYDKAQGGLIEAVSARSRERRDSLLKKIADRRDSEIKDLKAILGDLSTKLTAELGKQYVQLNLEGFQTEALKADRQALESRLSRIPEEAKRETEVIERRYANPVDRTFPVAVEFLVPETMSRRT